VAVALRGGREVDRGRRRLRRGRCRVGDSHAHSVVARRVRLD
jgi:hypothetical protein